MISLKMGLMTLLDLMLIAFLLYYKISSVAVWNNHRSTRIQGEHPTYSFHMARLVSLYFMLTIIAVYLSLSILNRQEALSKKT